MKNVKKLYVGNLPYRVSEAELENWLEGAGFAGAGVSIMTDLLSGQSRGFGFIEMANETVAQRAIRACNGQSFLGRTLIVNEAPTRHSESLS